MSDVPYLDRLGDALERAITPEPPHRRSWGPIAAAAGFAVVLGVGAVWWLVGAGRQEPRPDPVATTVRGTTTSTSVPTAEATVAVPAEWARVAGVEGLATAELVTLNTVTAGRDRFVAAGTASTGSELGAALVAESPDGATWTALGAGGLEGGFVNGVAIGADGALVAAGARLGVDDAPAPAFWRFADGAWAPASGVTTLPAGQANAVAAIGDGFVAVGHGYRDPVTFVPQVGQVWVSDDGRAWEERRAASFEPTLTAEVTSVAALGDRVAAGGLWSTTESQSDAVVWVSDELEQWQRIVLPGAGDGFAGVLGIAAGGPGLVAVGFEERPASAGAVWTSTDGLDWRRVPHDPALFAAAGTTRIMDVAAVPGGLVAVGFESVGPRSRKVFWTSTDGLAWARTDTTGSRLLDGGTTATGVAARDGTVVAVGGELALSSNGGIPAVWVSPVPAGAEAEAPVAAPEPQPQPDDAVTALELAPARATPATSVTVHVDGPRGEDTVVWLVAPDGEAVEACTAGARGGRGRWCRFRPADAGASQPGVYGVAAGDPAAPADGVELEVVPPGTELVRLAGLHTPFVHPFVQQLTITNDGDADLDLTGWAVEARTPGRQRFAFPDGVVLAPGHTAVVYQGGARGARCEGDTARFFFTCNHFPGGVGATAYWGSGAVLVDPAGELRAEWTPVP